MEPIFENERILTLLREADDAHRLLDRHGDSAQTSEIREALAGIYKDLGRHVHLVWRDLKLPRSPAPPEPAPPAAARRRSSHGNEDFEFRAGDITTQERTGESLDIDDSTDIPEPTDVPDSPEGAPPEDLERWYTDEVEINGPGSPLFGPGELEEAAETESVDVMPRGAGQEGLPSLAGKILASDADELVSVHGYSLSDVSAEPWVASLRELIGMIGAPPAEGSDLAEEVSRVQWATTQIDHRWAEFPVGVQTALVGLLAARARHLQDRLEVDLGPRLALERLRKHARATGLPPVAGIQADHSSDSATWSDDARRWWLVLSNGLDAGPPAG